MIGSISKRTLPAIFIVGLCILLTYQAKSIQADIETAPTAEFLAAALKFQEQACGPSLDVRYIVEGVREPKEGTGRISVRYVRTPATLFLEEAISSYTASGDWALSFTTRHNYTRDTRCYRMVSVAERNNPRAQGVIDRTTVHRFQQNTVFDPVRFPLLLVPLYERVATGIVASEQEIINGHACWRVDIPPFDAGGPIVRWSVWLDPNVGYCPRRIVETDTRATETRTTTTTFDAYKALGNGVWFPMESTSDYGNNKGLRMKVQSVTVGREIPASELRIEFPSGAVVRNGEDLMIMP